MIRDIVEIDDSKCDGCGECIPSCAEGALYLEAGKVRLKGDALCDGLGACLGQCSKGALRVVKRETVAFDEELVQAEKHRDAWRAKFARTPPEEEPTGGCPGSRPRALQPGQAPGATRTTARRGLTVVSDAPPPMTPRGDSQLAQWPVQLHLVSPDAPYLAGADLLLAADCVPFAYARFHGDLLAGRSLLVGCPKLDDLAAYDAKLTQIFRQARPRTVTVVKMEVPCCNGIAQVALRALAASGSEAPLEVVTVSIAGELMDRRAAR